MRRLLGSSVRDVDSVFTASATVYVVNAGRNATSPVF